LKSKSFEFNLREPVSTIIQNCHRKYQLGGLGINEEPNLAVKVLNLTKFYEETLAVDHINFEVEKGEIFGFLGPNGAGKTTTIRILTGILTPDEGEAEILGIDVIEDPLAAKQIMGVVPEVCNVYVDLSAWNNMILMGKLYGVRKEAREKETRELLQKFHLWYLISCIFLSGLWPGKTTFASYSCSWSGSYDLVFHLFLGRTSGYPLGKNCPNLRETSDYTGFGLFSSLG